MTFSLLLATCVKSYRQIGGTSHSVDPVSFRQVGVVVDFSYKIVVIADDVFLPFEERGDNESI